MGRAGLWQKRLIAPQSASWGTFSFARGLQGRFAALRLELCGDCSLDSRLRGKDVLARE